MRFSIMRRSSKQQRQRRTPSSIQNCHVDNLRKDVKEVMLTVLPCCHHRPSVYNEISKITQQLNEEIRSLGEEPVLIAGDFDSASDFESPTEDDINEKKAFVWYLPSKSDAPNTLVELQKDYLLLHQIWDVPHRRNVRSKLLFLRNQIQADLDTFHVIQKKKAKDYQNRLDQDRELLSFVLEQVQDRPHIYNHVIMQMQTIAITLHHAARSKNEKSARRRRFASQHQNQHQHQHRRTGNNKATTPLRWKKEDAPTAHNRWGDVARLDELMDAVPETSLALSDLLRSLQQKCREEAKTLQEAESLWLQRSQPTTATMSHKRTVSCPVGATLTL